MITVHPPAELVLDYCAGSLPEGVSLAVETHLAMCAECRREEARLMAVAGSLLEDLEGVALSPNALQTVLGRIDQGSMRAARAQPKAARFATADLPEPLQRYLPNGLAGAAWKKVGPWFEEARIKVSSSSKVSLMRLKAGSLMPRHTHLGREITVVLAGGYNDNGVAYGPGDFSVKDSADHHQPRVDDDGACLSLVVLEAPVRLTGRFAQLANLFVRSR